MPSSGPQADAARAEFREIIGRQGHAVDNARDAVSRLEAAFASGALVRSPEIDQTLADLSVALEQNEGQKLGGKSAEAARFITHRLDMLLEDA